MLKDSFLDVTPCLEFLMFEKTILTDSSKFLRVVEQNTTRPTDGNSLLPTAPNTTNRLTKLSKSVSIKTE